jgi:hypothetical protein
MPSQFGRCNGELLVSGAWGERNYGPMSKRIECGVLSAGAFPPSKRHHLHVTLVIGHCSYRDGQWILDEPVPEQIREIIRAATMAEDTAMA